MTLNDAQTRFISQLQTDLSLYQSNGDARLKTPAVNLEWNLKKLAGQGGETLDGPTFAQRTQADLELIAATLPVGAAGQAFAAKGATEVASLFGAAPTTAAAPASQAAPSAGEAVPAGVPATGIPSPAGTTVDVKSLLSEKAEAAGEELAWKTSVVDLLKLLGKDTSQSARHRYAVALGFPKDKISQMPSSEFNTWLHGQLMSSLAHNGGTLPTNIA